MRTTVGLLGFVAVGLLIASMAPAGTAQADAATATTVHHHHHRIRGKIVSIDGASITIKVHHHKKKSTATTVSPTATAGTAATVATAATKGTTETRTFKLGSDLKVVRGSSSATTAAATDLKVGDRVAISHHKGVAHVIEILPKKHHKKKTTTTTETPTN